MIEYINCNKCNGTGCEKLSHSTPELKIYVYFACEPCNGTGYFTWLERIFGKIIDQQIDFVVKNDLSLNHDRNFL